MNKAKSKGEDFPDPILPLHNRKQADTYSLLVNWNIHPHLETDAGEFHDSTDSVELAVLTLNDSTENTKPNQDLVKSQEEGTDEAKSGGSQATLHELGEAQSGGSPNTE